MSEHLVRCPEAKYHVPASIVDEFVLDSTDGSVAHVVTRCVADHCVTPARASLRAWPVMDRAGNLLSARW